MKSLAAALLGKNGRGVASQSKRTNAERQSLSARKAAKPQAYENDETLFKH